MNEYEWMKEKLDWLIELVWMKWIEMTEWMGMNEVNWDDWMNGYKWRELEWLKGWVWMKGISMTGWMSMNEVN